MATPAEMLARAETIGLAPNTIIIGEVKQDSTEYWTLSGKIKLLSGDVDVSFMEVKT